MQARAGALAVALLLALGAGACNATTDHRGPFKAPLERMNLVVTPEATSAMSRLGEPVRTPRLTPDGDVAPPDLQVPRSDSARQVVVDTAK